MANHFRSTERQESDGEETLFQPEPTTAAVTPQVIDDAEVVARLGDIADWILGHDRPIRNRVDDSVVRGWLARAMNASRGPQWVCDNCHNIMAEWSPVCDSCHAFDTLTWREPPVAARMVTAGNGVEMLPLKDLTSVTGYLRGGCSPVGMKKRFPTFLDERARSLQTVSVSAGLRGVQLLIAPGALLSFVGGAYAGIAD